MKKVCFIATISNTIEWFMLDQAKYLSENGFDVYIICNTDNNFRSKVPENITYIPVPMKRGIDFSCIKSIFKMCSIFSKQKFDVIEYTTPNASLYASVAGKVAGIHHRIYRQWGMVYIGFTGAKRQIFKLIEHITCLLSTYILPDSFGNLKFCRENKFYNSEKSDVILSGSACGINLNKFDIGKKNLWRKELQTKYSIKNDEFIIGYVGRINRDKGINELLTAFKKFSDAYGNTKLFLVGMSDRENEIIPEFLLWAKTNENVIFTGVTSETEKYYSLFDIYILPSYREGFGSTLIEAQAMEVPIITTDIIGPSEAISPNKSGLLINPKSSDELYMALEKLYKDKECRINFGKAGRLYVSEKFEQSKVFNANLAFLNKLLNIK
ncbi:MAG: glycosyltransferase family 4 protein [Clostridiales bacterium]|nr:glycosyltransferase family 4 protein [Clostridiales bacterium]